MPTTTTNDPSKGQLRVTVTGQVDGQRVTVEFDTAAGNLRKSLAYLKAQAFEPEPQPVVFDRLPDGSVLCPKHRVPMREREKQGDHWYAHRVITRDGLELWCHGYPSPSSPGYTAELAAPLVPSGQPAATVGHPLGCGAIAPAGDQRAPAGRFPTKDQAAGRNGAPRRG